MQLWDFNSSLTFFYIPDISSQTVLPSVLSPLKCWIELVVVLLLCLGGECCVWDWLAEDLKSDFSPFVSQSGPSSSVTNSGFVISLLFASRSYFLSPAAGVKQCVATERWDEVVQVVSRCVLVEPWPMRTKALTRLEVPLDRWKRGKRMKRFPQTIQTTVCLCAFFA